MTIVHFQIATCITKATNTHSEYVILTAFLLQQWLHKHALMWSYMCSACLFIISFVQSTSGYNFRNIILNTVFPFTVRSSKKPLLNRTTYTKQVPVSLASQKIPCTLYKLQGKKRFLLSSYMNACLHTQTNNHQYFLRSKICGITIIKTWWTNVYIPKLWTWKALLLVGHDIQ
jgi:hypothetical protein